MKKLQKNILAKINWQKEGGLVPAIVQDCDSRKVLMLGYMNEDALTRSFSEGRVWFFSRSKKRLWMKGETSGNVLVLDSVRIDCDGDALLLAVSPKGPTCHTGSRSCFDSGDVISKKNKCCENFRVESLSKPAPGPKRAKPAPESDFFPLDDRILQDLFQLICKRKKEMPKGSYTAELFREGLKKICAKVQEEAEEVCRAARSEGRQRVIEESSDVLYHLQVLLAESGVGWEEVLGEMRSRGKGRG